MAVLADARAEIQEALVTGALVWPQQPVKRRRDETIGSIVTTGQRIRLAVWQRQLRALVMLAPTEAPTATT
eukprot:3046070-Prymnesium_polylepis.1